MPFKKVVVAGGGVLGSQIAFQTAYSGFDVTIWLRSEGSIGRTKPKLEAIYKDYLAAIDKMATEEGKQPGNWCLGICEDPSKFDPEAAKAQAEKAYKSLVLELDMKKAFEGADLVIESMSEDKDAKIGFYKKAAPLLDEKTILVTNSSTMLPSTFAKYTGRPEKYLSLHFANEIWKNNTAEVMGQAKTSKEAYDAVVAFASDIHMIPLQLHKEKNGYILNSMLVPFLLSALDLWATGVSDPKTIDTTWVRGTGAPKGPFQICDVVGLKTCDDIVKMYLKVPSLLAPYHFKDINAKLTEMIEAKKLGVSAGEGFYKYK